MKISCNVIQDILGLYHDKACSQDTCLLVEEHIKECKECQKKLELIDDEIKYPQIEENDVKQIKSAAFVLKKIKIKSFVEGFLITILTVIVLALILYCFVGIQIS
jgi:lipid II:glycine glycyltransferase (peptidoglycan interpeptide bridge formation enzyme)